MTKTVAGEPYAKKRAGVTVAEVMIASAERKR
jgi:hypothetical protein